MPRTASPAAACWRGCSADGRRARCCGCLGGCAVVLRVRLPCMGRARWCRAAAGPRPGALLCAGPAGVYGGAVLLVGFSAGVSAAGLARWYMAAGLAAGALAWQKAVVPPLNHLAAAAARLLLAPARWCQRHIAAPLRSTLHTRLAMRKKSRNCRAARKKSGKIQKNWKKPVAKEVEDII